MAGLASALHLRFTHMAVVSEAAPLIGLLKVKTEETAGQCWKYQSWRGVFSASLTGP